MKAINIITLAFTIVGGLSWALMGLFGLDLMVSLIGEQPTVLTRTTYLIVGLAGLWQLYPLALAFQSKQVASQRYWA
jgi:uncharacterized membrane protein YuzA (DUF378 family)